MGENYIGSTDLTGTSLNLNFSNNQELSKEQLIER